MEINEIQQILDYLLTTVYSEVDDLISIMDHNKKSNNYGCFDQLYWRNKESNFPNVRLQEVVLTLAYLYSNPFPKNKFYGNKHILEFATAGMEYWTKLQHKDGSFDEHWKYEHSQAGTAFSLLTMAQSYEILNEYLEDHTKTMLKNCFIKSVNFLFKNPDYDFMNHEAVAISAIYYCNKIFLSNVISKKLSKKIKKMMDKQSTDGWFKEDDGTDSGYNTVTLTYLSLYYDDTKDEYILEFMLKLLEYISYFVYPDGYTGGGFNSRITGMLFPLGFIVLSDTSKLARLLTQITLKSLKDENLDGIFTLNNYRKSITLYILLWCYKAIKKRVHIISGIYEPEKNIEKYRRKFLQSNVLLVNTPFYCIVLGIKNACIGALFSNISKSTLSLSSPNGYNCISGIFGKTLDGLILTNNNFFKLKNLVISNKEVSIHISIILKSKYSYEENAPDYNDKLIKIYHLASNIGMRYYIHYIYNYIKKLKNILNNLILKKNSIDLFRKIKLEKDIIDVQNEVILPKNIKFEELVMVETLVSSLKYDSPLKILNNEIQYFKNDKLLMSIYLNKINITACTDISPKDLYFNNVKAFILKLPVKVNGNRLASEYKFKFYTY